MAMETDDAEHCDTKPKNIKDYMGLATAQERNPRLAPAAKKTDAKRSPE